MSAWRWPAWLAGKDNGGAGRECVALRDSIDDRITTIGISHYHLLSLVTIMSGHELLAVVVAARKRCQPASEYASA